MFHVDLFPKVHSLTILHHLPIQHVYLPDRMYGESIPEPEKKRWAESFFLMPAGDSDSECQRKATAIIFSKSVEKKIRRMKGFPSVGNSLDLFEPYTSYQWSSETAPVKFSPMKKYVWKPMITNVENDLDCSGVSVSPCILNLFYIDGPVAPANKFVPEKQFHHGGFLSPIVNNRKFDMDKARPIIESYTLPPSNEANSGLGAYHLFGFATEERDADNLATVSSLFDNFSPIQSLSSFGQVGRNIEMKDCKVAWKIFVSCVATKALIVHQIHPHLTSIHISSMKSSRRLVNCLMVLSPSPLFSRISS